MTTPGHSRSGFLGVGSSVCAIVTSYDTLPTGNLFPFFGVGERTKFRATGVRSRSWRNLPSLNPLAAALIARAEFLQDAPNHRTP